MSVASMLAVRAKAAVGLARAGHAQAEITAGAIGPSEGSQIATAVQRLMASTSELLVRRVPRHRGELVAVQEAVPADRHLVIDRPPLVVVVAAQVQDAVIPRPPLQQSITVGMYVCVVPLMKGS